MKLMKRGSKLPDALLDRARSAMSRATRLRKQLETTRDGVKLAQLEQKLGEVQESLDAEVELKRERERRLRDDR